MTCRFIPCFLCLPEKNGRSAARRLTGMRVPSITTNACPAFARCPQCTAELRGAGGQQPHRLGPRTARPSRCSTPNPAARSANVSPLRRRPARAGLAPWVELAPAGADLPAVTADHASDVGERMHGTMEARHGRKASEAPGQAEGCGDRFIYQGLRSAPSRRAAHDQPERPAAQDQDEKGSVTSSVSTVQILPKPPLSL